MSLQVSALLHRDHEVVTDCHETRLHSCCTPEQGAEVTGLFKIAVSMKTPQHSISSLGNGQASCSRLDSKEFTVAGKLYMTLTR